MKKLITIASMLFLCMYARSQNFRFPIKDDAIVYENVVNVDSTITKDLIYKSAKTWFVKTFKNAKYVIQSEDQQAGRIIGKGSIEIPADIHFNHAVGSICNFTIQIDVKDGKYRYRIFQFSTQGTDILNNKFYADLNETYNKYRRNEYKGALLYRREKLYQHLDESFNAIDININSMTESL